MNKDAIAQTAWIRAACRFPPRILYLLSSKCVHGVLNVDVQGSIETHSSNISDRITNKQCVFLIFW